MMASRQTTACPAWYSQFCEHECVALVIDASFERLPLGNILGGACGSLVMRVIYVLNNGFAGVQLVGVRHVMKEQQ